jgi:hypothetical protein
MAELYDVEIVARDARTCVAYNESDWDFARQGPFAGLLDLLDEAFHVAAHVVLQARGRFWIALVFVALCAWGL